MRTAPDKHLVNNAYRSSGIAGYVSVVELMRDWSPCELSNGVQEPDNPECEVRAWDRVGHIRAIHIKTGRYNFQGYTATYGKSLVNWGR